MNQHEIIISGLHMELTEAIKQAVHHKFEKLFRHQERILRINVEVMHENARTGSPYVAKAHIHINGPDITMSDSADDLYKAIDGLSEKLDRELRRRSRYDCAKRKDTHAIDLPVDLPKVTAD